MSSEQRIYLDHAATTPLDPRVLEAMLPHLQATWGNPSSIYAEGREARRTLDTARRTVAEILGARANDVVFTSGGSESDNAAIRGAAYASVNRGRHIITTAIEHHAVLHTVEQLECEGFEATYLPVDTEGFVDPADLERALRPDTTVVSIMYANNEVGAIEPLTELSRVIKAHDRHIIFHTDAVQAAGSLDLNVDRLGVDMLSITAHKFYGPKGVGALYIRPRTPFIGQTLGGSQERNRRAGTEDIPGAVGLATALQIAYEELDARNAYVRELRDYLAAELPARLDGVRLTGPADFTRRLPNSYSCCIARLEGESVLIQLDLNGISASSGSACTTGALEPSHVLTAMGLPSEVARGSLRITLGKDNTRTEIDYLLERLPGIVTKLRALAPVVVRGVKVGLFEHEVQVFDSRGSLVDTVRAWVDTGSTYCWLPSDLLSRMGIEPSEERDFVLSNGVRERRPVAQMRISLGGPSFYTYAAFAAPGEELLLGAVALEEAGLAVDPVNRRLVPASSYALTAILSPVFE